MTARPVITAFTAGAPVMRRIWAAARTVMEAGPMATQCGAVASCGPRPASNSRAALTLTATPLRTPRACR
jgi:ApbE superfamily uncharacterized protein (UPF0280 family)